jgi:ATP-dependent Zn protease
MSPKVGALNYSEDSDGAGPAVAMTRPYSDETAALIDAEVKRISDECLTQAMDLLTRNRAKLDSLVRALLEHDTLSEQEILSVTGLAARSDAESGTPELVASPHVASASVVDS